MLGKEYETVKEFEEDLKWFIHNCLAIHCQDRKIRSATRRIIGCVKDFVQVTKIVSCPECYESVHEYCKKGYCTKPCSVPHLLLWVKIKSNEYWPAKLMSFDADKKKVSVQFFGDYKRYVLEITRNSCYLYSEEYPGKGTIRHLKEFLKARKVSFSPIKIHIYQTKVLQNGMILESSVFPTICSFNKEEM